MNNIYKYKIQLHMKFNKSLLLLLAMSFIGGFASCDYIHDDLQPCPTGMDLVFRYDYNLQRADMFSDHVGSVSVYLFDENGKFLFKQVESNRVSEQPLRDNNYKMHLDLQPGKYQYVVEALQVPYEQAIQNGGANFVKTEPQEGDDMKVITHVLDHDGNGLVPNNALPLDTLWHGMRATPIEVVQDKVTQDTVSLVRDTKQISVSLREIDDPTRIDVADYDFRITDKNSRLLWDNSVDESVSVFYTPYATRNTEDKSVDGQIGSIGRMAHADFMTSRLLYHDKAADDAVLSITNKKTGREVVRVNLPDILSRLRSVAEIYRYTPQEFLDRGYDYQLTFFLKGDTWEYANVEISVLSWAKRIQYETVGF